MDEPDSPPPGSSLAALLRLWTLRRATIVSGPSARFLAALSCAWLFLWLAIDWWEAQPDAQFVAGGVPLLAWYGLAILALAELLRIVSRPRATFQGTLMLTLALVPLPLLIAVGPAPLLPTVPLLLTMAALLIYIFIFLARGLRSMTGRSQRSAALLGVAFFMGFVCVTDALDVIPDVWASPEVEQAADVNSTQADAEALLFDQSARIDSALAAMRPDASTAPKAFFLGF